MPAPQLILPPRGSTPPASRLAGTSSIAPARPPPRGVTAPWHSLGSSAPFSGSSARCSAISRCAPRVRRATLAGDRSSFPSTPLPALSIVASLAVYWYTRRHRESKISLDLGLAYMIASSLGVGLLFHIGMVYFGGRPPAQRVIAPEISWVGVEILLFAALIPTHPRKTVIAALVAASMNPIGMLIARAHGVWDFGSAWNVLLMHYPDFLIVGAAGVISHVVTQLGRQVTRARGDGQLSTGRAPRARRDGRGLQGDAHHARPGGRDQADQAGGVRRRPTATAPTSRCGGSRARRKRRRISARRTRSRSTTSASPRIRRCTS